MIAALPRRFPARGTAPLSLLDGLVSNLLIGNYSDEEAPVTADDHLERLFG